MKIPITTKLIIIIFLAVSACHPGGPEYTSDYDLIGTDYDAEYWQNQSPSTYYMPDSLGWIIDREDIDNNEDLSRDYDEFILDEVASNMAALGYQRIDELDESNLPDLIVFTEALAVKNTTVGYIPWYPWYGGYYPGWGGYWPGYGYTPVAYSYTTGTILIEMADANSFDEENGLINMVWSAGVDGMLRNSSSSNQQYVIQSIEQAFNQSPYLKRD